MRGAKRRGAARHGATVLRHSKHWGSRDHHTSRVQTDESLRVSTSSPTTDPAPGLIWDSTPGPEGEEKCVRVKPERKNVCAARAVTDEVYELHHAACQREREAAESYSGRDGGRTPPSGQTSQLHTNTCCSFSGCNKFSFHVSLYVSSIIIIKCVSFSVLFYINCGILSLFSCISVHWLSENSCRRVI